MASRKGRGRGEEQKMAPEKKGRGRGEEQKMAPERKRRGRPPKETVKKEPEVKVEEIIEKGTRRRPSRYRDAAYDGGGEIPVPVEDPLATVTDPASEDEDPVPEKKKKTRPRVPRGKRAVVGATSASRGSSSSVDKEENRKEEETEQPPPVKKRRGRRPKKGTAEIHDLLTSRRISSKKAPAVLPGVELTDDQRQDLRYNEEFAKLSVLDEALLLCDIRAESEDVEEFDGDEMGLEDSDEDEFSFKDGDAKCPRPGPRKGRGGPKKSKNAADVELSAEEIKEMSLIIKGSIRKSLTRNKTATDILNELDSERREENLQLVPQHTDNGYIVYRSLRNVLDLQKQWLREKSALPESESAENLAAGLCSYQLEKNGVGKQLYIEHLTWLSIVALDEDITYENLIVCKNGVLAWLPQFKHNFAYRYPALAEDLSPGSCSDVDMALQYATLKAFTKLTKTLDCLIKARGALGQLTDLCRKVKHDKRNIGSEFEIVHANLNTRHIRFDETSVWGLKPIRLALEPPYFKTDDGMLAAPAAPDAVERYRNSRCFFKRDKQKWTTKDLQQLRSSIKEVLVTRRLGLIESRYESLMHDCLRRYDAQQKGEGRFDAPPAEPLRKTRGKAKKSELELTSNYGVVYPVVKTCENGTVLRGEVSPKSLSQWRANEERKLRQKSYEELVSMKDEIIDWDAVANKMVAKSKKHRSPHDCELAWRHEVHPEVNDKRWGKEESERLAAIYRAVGNDWFTVAEQLNAAAALQGKALRTPYQCFFRIRNKISPPKKLDWNRELDDQLLKKLQEHPGNWRVVAASLGDPAATKRQCIERYKKTANPVLRSGPFTRVEDCLLILTIEKLKPFLAREGHFGCLLAYLPWRCETTWRDRANNLFSDWIVPWTLEEVKMLLELAETMNRNWQQVSEEFTSFKNRKGCLTRFKILNARLADKRFNNSLEAYHEAYSMTRYNVFQYKHLKEVLTLLERVRDKPLPPERRNFVGLLRNEKPAEVRLQHMLLTFDTDVLNATIKSLSRYIETRDNYWKTWIETHGQRKRTFDRRTFHPDNPQSVASAIHIRGLELKKKEDIPNLSDFENEVFKFHGRFCRTKALKPDADRPYIPDAKTLAQWGDISRLIATPIEELDDVPIKKKWKALQTDSGSTLGKRKRKAAGAKRGRAAGAVGKEYKKRGPKPKPKGETKPKRSYVSKKRGVKKDADEGEGDDGSSGVSSNSDGFILIPPMPSGPKKRGRKKKVEVDADSDDPEYVAVATKNEGSDEEEEITESKPSVRRSTRAVKRRYSPEPELMDDEYDV